MGLAIGMPAVEAKPAGVPPVSDPGRRAAVAVAETTRTPRGLPHRELRRWTRRRLSFRARQGCANELTMNRTLFFDAGRRLDGSLRLGRRGHIDRRLGASRGLGRLTRRFGLARRQDRPRAGRAGRTS
jgi:hypothetical protein